MYRILQTETGYMVTLLCAGEREEMRVYRWRGGGGGGEREEGDNEEGT